MNDELYHHGVRGMKWGKRNGPPYPLNETGKASLRKQRMDSYGKSVTKGGEYSDNRVSREQKKQIKEAKRKITFNDYNSQDKHKLVKNTAIGTILGGPVLGITVGLITDNSIRKGKAISSLHLNDKVSDVLNSEAEKDDELINGKYPSGNQYDELKKLRRNNNFNEYYTKLADYTKNLSDSDRMQYLEDFRPQDMSEKDFLRKVKSYEKSQGWDSKTIAEYNKTRNSFNNDERKDIWQEAFDKAHNTNLTEKQREYNKEFANRVKEADERNKNYKSPNKGKYDIVFLEAIQNKEILEINDTKSIDAEYEKYKKNPEEYFTNTVNKLRDL